MAKRKYKKPIWLNENNHKMVKMEAAQAGLNMEQYIQEVVEKNKREKKKYEFISF